MKELDDSDDELAPFDAPALSLSVFLSIVFNLRAKLPATFFTRAAFYIDKCLTLSTQL